MKRSVCLIHVSMFRAKKSGFIAKRTHSIKCTRGYQKVHRLMLYNYYNLSDAYKFYREYTAKILMNRENLNQF